MRLSKRLIAVIGLLILVSFGARSQGNAQPLLAKLDCPDRVKDVAFSPDGKLLAAGFGWNDAGGVRIWNLADRSVVATLTVGKGEDENIDCVAFSPDGKLFAAANWDGDVRLWSVGVWNKSKTVIANRGSSQVLRFSPDSSKLGFASEKAAIIHDLTAGKSIVLSAINNNRDSFISLSFAPTGKSVFVFRDDAVQIYDLASRRLIDTWKPSDSSFFGNVSDDGDHVIAGGGSIYGKKSVEIWNAKDRKRIAEFRGFRSGIFALSISHSAKYFALAGGSYGSGGTLSLWNLTEPREIGYVSFGEFPIDAIAFSPDDKILAAGSNDNAVLLYDVARIHGPEVKKQDQTLCGEILNRDGKTYIVPISKAPGMAANFVYAWQLEILNSDLVDGLSETPVVLEDWNIESSSDADRVRVVKYQSLQLQPRRPNQSHIVFGDIQNPGWNAGAIVKVYDDGSFLATTNYGRCLAYGGLDQLQTNFDSVKKRLIDSEFLSLPGSPLTSESAHFRTRFIEISSNGSSELRTDAEDMRALLNGGPAKKREAFTRVYEREEKFIDSLLKAGIKLKP